MQKETIIRQLDAGVRYFDLRIARKPRDSNSTRLYFHHGLYTHTDVEVKKKKNTWKKLFLPLKKTVEWICGTTGLISIPKQSSAFPIRVTNNKIDIAYFLYF